MKIQCKHKLMQNVRLVLKYLKDYTLGKQTQKPLDSVKDTTEKATDICYILRDALTTFQCE